MEDYFNRLVQQLQSAEEDLEIARTNGRQRDEWMDDREKEVAFIRSEINRVWPIMPAHGTDVEL